MKVAVEKILPQKRNSAFYSRAVSFVFAFSLRFGNTSEEKTESAADGRRFAYSNGLEVTRQACGRST
jgi:hypothetical protein